MNKKFKEEKLIDEWGEEILLNENIESLSSKWCKTKSWDYSPEVYDKISFKQGQRYCKLNF